MSTLAKILGAIAARVPGTAQHLAQHRRELERELRAAGYSRSHAKAIAADRLRIKP
ncbi:MAG: hypothetical protein ABI409_13205 [Ramlibacter sp.]